MIEERLPSALAFDELPRQHFAAEKSFWPLQRVSVSFPLFRMRATRRNQINYFKWHLFNKPEPQDAGPKPFSIISNELK